MVKKIFRSLSVCALLCISFALVGHAETVVKWDSLKKLDVLAERCEALSDAHDVAELRKLVQPVKAAAAIVATDPVPVGAKAPDQVKVLQSDLKSLTDVLTDPGPQTDAELTAILASVHPIVEKLMEGAGMPHVYENEAPPGKPAKETRP
jgi:hypothetical protein